MNEKRSTPLGDLVRQRRTELGLSLSEVARRAGLDKAALSRLESGVYRLTPESLVALAPTLELPLADLYAAADYLPASELPSISPYMRAKYHELPDEAVAEVEAFIEKLTRQHGTGPRDHEDEH